MRIQLSSGSSSADSDRDDQRHERRAHVYKAVGAQSPIADRAGRSPDIPLTVSTSLRQGATRRRSHHLDRINALRSTPPAKPNLQSRDDDRRSIGPSWMCISTPEKSSVQSSPTHERRVTFSDHTQRHGRRSHVEESDSSEESSSSLVTAGSEEEDLESSILHRSAPGSSCSLRRGQREASVEAQDVASSIRLGATGPDEGWRRLTNRLTSPVAEARRTTVASPKALTRGKTGDDFDEVHSMLERMRIRKQKDESEERRSFEARNKALWDRVEKGIEEAERAREAALKREEDRKRRVKEEQEATEKRAREAREAEEKRKREEEAASRREKEQEQEKARAEEAARDKAAQERTAAEAKAKSASGMGNGLAIEAGQEYEKWASKMTHIKQSVLPAVSANADWRKQCFTAKRQITRGIGQLTNSRQEIVRITRSINDVLTQAQGASPNGEIYTWILNHLAKCLIRQAEQETAAKQDTAYPLARVVVWLMLEGQNELGEVLMARLNKKCCWVLAYCPPKKAGEDDALYSKRLGKSSIDETSQQHTSRMSGIVALYFAIAQTSLSSPPSGVAVDKLRIPEHFRISALWKWQARAIAPSFLEHVLTPALWSVLLEIAGPRLLLAYGRQTGKVWSLLRNEGLRAGKAGFTSNANANSAKVRLQLLLDDWSTSGRVDASTAGREMES